LPPELLELQEILAANVHDAWACQRIAEGWVLGVARDEQARTHPGLVPYEELPESEKQYDRETAFTTIRTVLARGYRIVPPPRQWPGAFEADELNRELSSLRDLVQAADAGSLGALLMCWRGLPIDCRWHDLELARQFVGRLLELNEPLVAFDCVTEGLENWPNDLRLQQLQGLSLARSGAVRKANQVFRALRDAGHRDEETLANLARTYKTLWHEARAPEERQLQLSAAYEAYLDSYRTTAGTWSGINVAFLALMRGDLGTARDMADRVYRQCLVLLDGEPESISDRYWTLATLGEAALIQGRAEESRTWYLQATAVAGKRYGNVASTRHQAKRLVAQLQLDWTPFVECFPLPAVLLCITVREAWPRNVPCPTEVQSRIMALARAEVAVRQPVLGFGCLRNWLDLLFFEAVLQAGGEAAVLLDEWEPDGVEQGEADFHERAARVVRNCCEEHRVTARIESVANPDQDYAARIVTGLATMQARQLDLMPVVLSLPRADPFILHGQASGSEITAVSPARTSDPQRSAPILSTVPKLMSLLFADVRGYSRLTETQILVFAREFLGRVAALVEMSPVRPVTRHTWGDGLFLAFNQIHEAGEFALDLAEMIDRMDWRGVGLPADLSIRIGLHAGPVYECLDPVSGQPTFCGVHVNHAARIEPITPPGNVYASEAFAALASAEGVCGFVCEYVGRTPLAKDFGLFSTYHVRRGAPEQP
jgi:class 3 adenylate cyclase